jgi:hypothetical protein
MLPKHHYSSKDSAVYNDSNWISEQIDMLPISMQKDVISKYSDIYLKLTIDEDRKVRFRANTWLRNTVNKNKITNKEGLF